MTIKKIQLQIDVPEYQWVDVPVLYRTPLNEVGSMEEVKKVQNMIGYMQRNPDIDTIVNMESNFLQIVCEGVVRKFYDKADCSFIYYMGGKLKHFLAKFRYGSGQYIRDYKFEHTVLSNGKKIQFKTFSMMFDTEEAAIQHIAKIYTCGDKFKYEVLA